MNKNSETKNQHEIVLKNLILDIRSVYVKNFIDSNKGYLLVGLYFIYLCKKNIPSFKYFPNNSSVPLDYIKKNKTLRVSTTQKTVRNFKEPSDEYTEQNKIVLHLKHKPYIKYTFLNKKPPANDKQIVLNNNDLVIHLACIDYLSKEGVYALKKLIEGKKLFLQLNHINYHDTPQVYGWLFYRSWLFKVNINELLVKSGYAKLGPIKDTDIYDEYIYYYHADLVQAEEDAKAEGKGIWRNMRNKLNEQHNVISRFLRFMTKYFSMKRWEKAIYRK
jgi:hypothetical protein